MLAITGANGNLGRRLVRMLAAVPGAPGASLPPPRALVRSDAATRALGDLALAPRLACMRVDYLDVEAMANALAGCSQVVHLVGILKETRVNRYADAHEQTARVLVAAARQAGVRQLVCLSILGADAAARNACLRSRGRADAILLAADCDVIVLRIPMVLGEGDYAARALAGRARRAVNVSLRASSWEQPIYAGDVIAAITALLAGAVPGTAVLELAGPEPLRRRALIARAAGRQGRRTRVLSLPLASGLALAAVLERISVNPPITRAMLGVLDHDDRIDSAPVAARLGIALTPLDTALDRVLGHPSG